MNPSPMSPLQAYFAGRWRDASGPRYTTEYPATGEPVASLHAATAADVDEALQFAQAAMHKADWAGLMPHQRAAILHRMSRLISEQSEELARLQRLDNGKPVKECRALVASAAGTFQYFAAVCETFEDAVTPQRGPFMSLSLHQPLGVVAAITPWNSPIASEAQKIAPALAAGCAIAIKPAEITPRMAIELARIGEQAGLPPGILSVLPGKGSVVGDALVRHPLVKRVAFTGGTNVGLGLAELAAKKLMPVSLELGGKSPTIVCADADLDHAVAGVLYGIFSSSGESCIAGSRAFVHASVYEEFKRRLLEGAAKLRVGNPALEDTHMGPLVNAGHRASVQRYIDLAREEGGQVLCGGQPPVQGHGLSEQETARGYYLQPTIIEGLPNTARVCREEIFGPVLCLLRWDDEAAMIAQANDNEFGLACGIWSRDFATALRLGRAITAGTVWVNTYKLFSISTPFTGYKMSGLGREKGYESIREYLMQKSFYIGTNAAPLPWSQA
jgi:betaine-aldehyde dehydrogenase